MNNNLEMGKEHIGSLLIKIATPAAFGLLLQAIYMMIDGIFVGQAVGPEGLAAINLTYPALSIGTAVAFMIMIGSSTYTSIELGKEKPIEASIVFSMCAKALLYFSIILALIGVLFSNEIAHFLNADDSVREMAASYLKCLSLFLPTFMFSMYFDTGLRIIGKPVTALLVLAGSSIMNICLDYIMIMKWNWGVEGAAIATGVSQLIAMLFMLKYFIGRKSVLSLHKTPLKWKRLKPILFNGLSEFLTGIAVGFSTYIFNIYLMNIKGALGVSVYAIIQYVIQIVIMVYIGLATGMQPIVSFNYGAQNQKRVKVALRYASWFILGFGSVSTLTLYFFGSSICKFFVGNQPELILLASNASKITAFMFIPVGLNIILSTYFTSIDKPVESAIIAVLRSFGFIAIFMFILPSLLGLNGVWIVLPAAEVTTLIVAILLFGRLTKLRLKHNKNVFV